MDGSGDDLSPPSLDDLLAHTAFVRSVAASVLGDPAEADDVVQEAVVRALAKPLRKPTLRAWLGTVARNLARSVLRSRGRRQVREIRAARPERTVSTADAVAGAEVRSRVAQAVLALPAPQRAVVLLRFHEGLGPRRIAQRLGLPLETVRSRLRRARERLGRQLAPLHERRKGTGLAFLATGLLGTRAVAAGTVVATIAVLLLGSNSSLGRALPRSDATEDNVAKHARTQAARSAPGARTAAQANPVPEEATPDTPFGERSKPTTSSKEHVLWELVARTPSGDPIPGIGFGLMNAEGNVGPGNPTDADGVLRIPTPVGATRITVACYSLGMRRFTLHKSRTVLRLDEFLPVEIRVVDGRDGRPLAGGRVEYIVGYRFPLVEQRPGLFRLPATGASRGFGGQMFFYVRGPGGFVAAESVALGTRYARTAHRLRAVVPLWPEARLRVRAVDSRGHAVAGAGLRSFTCAGKAPPVQLSWTAADGWMDVHRVPHLPGEEVRIELAHGKRSGQASFVWGTSASMELVIPLDRSLPPAPTATSDSMRIDPRWFQRRADEGAVLVRVRRRDGTPAPHAQVAIRGSWRVRADAGGIARIRGVREGLRVVELQEPGLVPTCVSVRVRRNGQATVDLVEARGRTVRLRVLDGGRPRPFARIHVDAGFGVLQTVDGEGTQHLASYADVRGEVDLHGLPHWPVVVTAGFGGRKTRLTVPPDTDRVVVHLGNER